MIRKKIKIVIMFLIMISSTLLGAMTHHNKVNQNTTTKYSQVLKAVNAPTKLKNFNGYFFHYRTKRGLNFMFISHTLFLQLEANHSHDTDKQRGQWCRKVCKDSYLKETASNFGEVFSKRSKHWIDIDYNSGWNGMWMQMEGDGYWTIGGQGADPDPWQWHLKGWTNDESRNSSKTGLFFSDDMLYILRDRFATGSRPNIDDVYSFLAKYITEGQAWEFQMLKVFAGTSYGIWHNNVIDMDWFINISKGYGISWLGNTYIIDPRVQALTDFVPWKHIE